MLGLAPYLSSEVVDRELTMHCLAQAPWRIGGGGHRGGSLWAGGVRRDVYGSRLGDSRTGIYLKMVFGAGRAEAFARILIAQAGKLVAAADAIAVAGFGSGLDGDERHCK